MSIEVRLTRPNELRHAEVVTTALMGPLPTDEVWERRGPSWLEMPSVTAWDGDRCIGHAGQFPVDTVVPGGARLPSAAVTRVGVLPTHRRRRVATQLIERLVAESVHEGHAMMSLRASETGIYRRFGFGLAGDSANLDIDVIRATPLQGADASGSFELLGPDDVLGTIPPLYEAVAFRRAGVITRPSEPWWRRQFDSVLDRSKASFVVVHLDAAGHTDGYVHYSTAWYDDQPDEAPTGRGEVHDLFGADDAVELALWQYLLDVDLVTRWRASGRPIDDPVRLAARDHRAVRVRVIEDEQWVRLVDVDVALAARTYRNVNAEMIIGVIDPLVPANNRSWRISATGAARSDDQPGLSVDIAALSALYLGGRSWEMSATLGEVDVNDPDALQIGDALFGTRRAPFCGTFF